MTDQFKINLGTAYLFWRKGICPCKFCLLLAKGTEAFFEPERKRSQGKREKRKEDGSLYRKKAEQRKKRTVRAKSLPSC